MIYTYPLSLDYSQLRQPTYSLPLVRFRKVLRHQLQIVHPRLKFALSYTKGQQQNNQRCAL